MPFVRSLLAFTIFVTFVLHTGYFLAVADTIRALVVNLNYLSRRLVTCLLFL